MKIIILISFLSFILPQPVKLEKKETKRLELNIEHPKVEEKFLEFLSLFNKVDLPFQVGIDDFDHYQNQKQPQKLLKSNKKRKAPTEDQQLLRTFIQDYHFMSRMGPPSILPVARFYPNEHTIAIVYIPYRTFGNSQDLLFQMATFDLKGNRITTEKEAEGFASSGDYFTLGHNSNYDNKVQTFTISEKNQIEKKTYKTIRKIKSKKVAIHNNPITDYVLQQTEIFKIGTDGLVTIVKDRSSFDRALVE